MVTEINVRVLPKVASSEKYLKEYVEKEHGYELKRIKAVHILKRSIDARQRLFLVLRSWPVR